ncbi:hypothetical protein QJS10_CPB20g00168 [Acorus calamus]|uniref:Uncharacterized protein n=1 Tax=Acorus calamus TaxID=4465 RepID=A0AAV9CBY3_ACOCL|nr:hypothetical protein QJS10_CPB20g00168 [Acorus calamus]
MEVGNVNRKHMVLALKVKSILDPYEDENEDLQEDEEGSLGADSLQQDDSSSSDSEALTEEIIDKLLKEGLLLKSGRDIYTINKGKESFPDVCVVKEEVDVPDTQHVEKSHNNSTEDCMYMKALYHALPMEYISVPKLKSKLKGEANQTTIRKFIDKMTEDGLVDNKFNK